MGQKKSTKRKPLFTWRLPGGTPKEVKPHGATQQKRQKEELDLLYFSFGSKEKYQKKTAIYWTLAGGRTPKEVKPHGETQQKRQKEEQDLLYFSFGSKEKYQKKTAIYWIFAGGRTPKEVKPHGATQEKQHKKIPAFHRCTRVEAGFSFASFLFDTKRKEDRLAAQNLGRSRFFFCFFSF